MARADNVIVAQTLPGAYPVLPLTAAQPLTFTAGDAAVGHQTALVNRKTVVIAKNTNGAATARTVSFISVVDGSNRTGDISAYELAAGEEKVFGPFESIGWAHTGGVLWIDVSHAEMKLAVIQLP
jgi:hypothetical protein